MNKLAVMMDLPMDKLPGFYAQIVKALANKTQLFDRDKELLIVNNEDEAAAVKEVLDRFHIKHEDLELTLLPESSKLFPTADDFGFQSRSGLFYLYTNMVSFFHFTSNLLTGEEAYLQMEEHLLASYDDMDVTWYVVERQFEELIHGIAKAYRCEVKFVRKVTATPSC